MKSIKEDNHLPLNYSRFRNGIDITLMNEFYHSSRKTGILFIQEDYFAFSVVLKTLNIKLKSFRAGWLWIMEDEAR